MSVFTVDGKAYKVTMNNLYEVTADGINQVIDDTTIAAVINGILEPGDTIRVAMAIDKLYLLNGVFAVHGGYVFVELYKGAQKDTLMYNGSKFYAFYTGRCAATAMSMVGFDDTIIIPTLLKCGYDIGNITKGLTSIW